MSSVTACHVGERSGLLGYPKLEALETGRLDFKHYRWNDSGGELRGECCKRRDARNVLVLLVDGNTLSMGMAFHRALGEAY